MLLDRCVLHSVPHEGPSLGPRIANGCVPQTTLRHCNCHLENAPPVPDAPGWNAPEMDAGNLAMIELKLIENKHCDTKVTSDSGRANFWVD